MSNAKLCDICGKPIVEKQSIIFNHGFYNQYKVKIKKIEEGWSLAGSFKKSEYLDVCPSCMDKFVEFVKGVRNE